MLIVQFDNTLSIDDVPLYPGVRYVVSEDVAQQMVHAAAKAGIKLLCHSGFNNYERRLRPEAIKTNDTVLLWRHNAFGDNIMITGLCAYLRLGLGVRVHVVCAPHVIPIWHAMDKDIRPNAIIPTPVHFESTQRIYDWHVLWQGMLEENREPDQECGIDDMWQFAGFDREIAENYRRPIIRRNGKPNGDAIGIALHSGNCTRTLPLQWNVELMKALHKKYPKRAIKVFGLDKDLSKELDKCKLPVDNLVGKISFQETMRITEEELGVMISPDSALLHLAEGFGIPSIGLWGLFHPDDRTKHYKHHTAIDGFEGCAHAPCRWHGMNEFPLDKCGKLKVKNHCNALSSIDVERVVDAI